MAEDAFGNVPGCYARDRTKIAVTLRAGQIRPGRFSVLEIHAILARKPLGGLPILSISNAVPYRLAGVVAAILLPSVVLQAASITTTPAGGAIGSTLSDSANLSGGTNP